MNHSQKEQNRQPVFFLRTRDADDVPCYFVLRTSEKHFNQLRRCTSPIDLSQYGEVLHSGYGDPTPTERKMLKDRYRITVD